MLSSRFSGGWFLLKRLRKNPDAEPSRAISAAPPVSTQRLERRSLRLILLLFFSDNLPMILPRKGELHGWSTEKTPHNCEKSVPNNKNSKNAGVNAGRYPVSMRNYGLQSKKGKTADKEQPGKTRGNMKQKFLQADKIPGCADCLRCYLRIGHAMQWHIEKNSKQQTKS